MTFSPLTVTFPSLAPGRRAAYSLLLLTMLAAGVCRAENQSYTTTVGGASLQPEVLIYYADNAAYVPIFDLARKLGGSARMISPSQAEVTVGEHLATISLNNVHFEVGGTGHDLKKPFLPYEKEVLAPRDETVSFFKSAFGVDLNSGSTPSAAPAPAEPEMLEPVAAPAPAATPATDAGKSGETGKPAGGTEEAGLLETSAIAPVEEQKADAKPGSVKTIVIDPGHGGNDAGAQGATGLTEKDVCLSVANKLAELLKKDARFTVVMTRGEDKAMTIAERAALVKQQPGAFVVSIHASGSLSKSAAGLEIFYAGDFARSRVTGSKGREAADKLAKALESESGAVLRGVRRAPLQLFSQSGAPGCLVEMGYLTNAEEEGRLATGDYQDKLAHGLAKGLEALAEGK